MLRLLAAILFAGALRSQTSAPETKDPLGRSTARFNLPLSGRLPCRSGTHLIYSPRDESP